MAMHVQEVRNPEAAMCRRPIMALLSGLPAGRRWSATG